MHNNHPPRPPRPPSPHPAPRPPQPHPAPPPRPPHPHPTPPPRPPQPHPAPPRPPYYPPGPHHQPHPPIWPPVRPVPPIRPMPPPLPPPSSVRPPAQFTDHGPNPYIVEIDKAAMQNGTYRTALWTGRNLQMTLMTIPVGSDVGLEVHPDNDQFLCIVSGQCLVQMGEARNRLTIRQAAFDNYGIFVPAGTWHNVINVGTTPLKLYTMYGPPDHPWGTIENMKTE